MLTHVALPVVRRSAAESSTETSESSFGTPRTKGRDESQNLWGTALDFRHLAPFTIKIDRRSRLFVSTFRLDLFVSILRIDRLTWPITWGYFPAVNCLRLCGFVFGVVQPGVATGG